jgi:multidrug efflux pump subunit AcrA (membrane-fusion protein)
LRPGEFVRASVKLPDTHNTNLLFVPAAAVQPLGEDDVVFVEREPGLFEVRKVRVERQTAQVAAIGDGLSRGERIAIEGAFLLRGEVSKQ